MGMIERALTEDGRVGFDKQNQLCMTTQEDGYEVITYIRDVREMTCMICNHGWEMTCESFGDQAYWSLVEAMVHETCLIRHTGLNERDEFYAAMTSARSGDVKVRFEPDTIPNGYWCDQHSYDRPWYRFKLLDYPVWFIIGSRKRVVSIEAIPNGGELSWWREAADAFASEDVTKHFRPDSVLLHAWNRDKVKEYVAKLAWFSEGRTVGVNTYITQGEFDSLETHVPYEAVIGSRWKSLVHPALRVVSHVEEWNLGELVDQEDCPSFHVESGEKRFGIRWTRIVVKEENT